MSSHERRVSFDDEPLVVVDQHDNVLGYKTKADVHKGAGILHRAFSVFLFNGRGELLLQRRSEAKLLWPRYWSNSCCSHPRHGETHMAAVERRLLEELGVTTEPEFLFRFQYYAPFDENGSERELCSVFLGHADGPVDANRSEVAEWKWMPILDFEADLQRDSAAYTPWLKLEWAEMRSAHWSAVERYARL